MASSQRATTHPDQMEELLFAWKVAKHVKSNAIVVTRDRTLGIGAGQMNRVGSSKLPWNKLGKSSRSNSR